MNIFNDVDDLFGKAVGLITERANSLEKDVDYCLQAPPYAPIPAIEYCFSTIDFLGAIYAGDARYNRPTTTQSRKYMTDLMNYTEENATLLQDVFRHKMVHMAMANVLEYDSKILGWKWIHEAPAAEHLKLTQLQGEHRYEITDFFSIYYEYQFTIGIKNLKKDICESITRPRIGLLARIQQDPTFQSNFEKALIDLYNPWNHKTPGSSA